MQRLESIWIVRSRFVLDDSHEVSVAVLIEAPYGERPLQVSADELCFKDALHPGRERAHDIVQFRVWLREHGARAYTATPSKSAGTEAPAPSGISVQIPVVDILQPN